VRDLLSRLVIVIALISIIGCSAAPAAPDAASAQSAKERAVATAVDSDVHEATRGNAALALDLYRQLRREGGNLFFSPHSISLALAMTYAGARGTTATEMAETLHYTLPSERLHAAFNTLDQLLAQRGADAQGQDGEGFRLTIANAVWGQTGFPFLEPFLDTLAEHYGAGMRLVDYEADAEAARRTINAWVSDETEERITELLGPGAVDAATRLVLTNAIYFNAAWAYPFQEHATEEGTFYGLWGEARVPLMHQTTRLRYAEGADYQAVELPYDGHELAMTIVLPAEGAFEAFEESLDAERVAEIAGAMEATRVALTLPRYELETELSLADTLAALGMPSAFGADADFAGMTGTRDLFISDVLHKAFVSVDEAGTEAAAATAVVMAGGAAIDEPVAMVVDRPFLTLIHDLETGALLFVGRIVDL
jgi:serpin B